MNRRKIVDVDSKPDPKKQKLFFGDFGHYLRVDKVSHIVAKNLKEQSEANTWFPKKFNFQKDRIAFPTIEQNMQDVFKYNICFQTLMDSGVDAAYATIMKRIVTNSIWNILYGRIAIEEQIHAESYSHGLSEMFGEASEEILDLVYSDPFIKTRLEAEVDAWSEVDRIVITEKKTDDEAKIAILTALIRTIFLESVKFPFSFYVTFNINKVSGSAIIGMCNLIRDIAHDELTVHVPANKNAINILRKEKHQGFSHLFENGLFSTLVKTVAYDVYRTECEWSSYLLNIGEFQGFTKEINEHFLRYRIDQTLEHLHEDSIYNEPRNDIDDWFDDYRDTKKHNAAQQETDGLNYQKDSLVNDLDKFDLLLEGTTNGN